MHPKFKGIGVSTIDHTFNIISGHPYGAVSILIRI